MESLASQFGYAGLFCWIFLEQIGLPIPAFPVLLAAGAFVSAGRMALAPCVVLIVVASLTADLIWFYLGRTRGGAVLNLLCRFSWKPDTCITLTTNVFSKHGAPTLLFAKFVPGLNTIAPPLAGVIKMPLRRFLAYDTAGTLIWGLVPLLAGMGLRDAIPTPEAFVAALRGHLSEIASVLLAAFVLWRWLRRRAYVKELRSEVEERGIAPEELKALLDGEQEVTVIDVRYPGATGFRPIGLPGARMIAHKDLKARASELALEKPLVAYCDCPEDQGAVSAVQKLRKLGASSARPLKGGLEGWRSRGFATIPV